MPIPALNQSEESARKRICFALDAPTAYKAIELALELGPYVGLFKIGKELHTAAAYAGARIIQQIHDYSPDGSSNIFLDLKFHDTPNTVYQASRAATVPGVGMFNVHIAGGERMCKEALNGAYEAAFSQKIEHPRVIGVTVLTSLNDVDLVAEGLGISCNDLVRRRTELAKQWSLDGVVCPASQAGALEKEFGSDFLYVTPGIEWAGVSREGQKQLYTPDKAVQDCKNSILVIGGAIAKASDKPATAYAILQAMAPYV